MLGTIGSILINTAFLLGFLSLTGYFLYSQKEDNRFFTISNWLFGLKGLLILAASGILVYLILTHQFNYYYVYNYTSSDLQLKYLISAYWGGQEGSFMLWILLSALVGLGLMKWVRKPYRGPVLFFLTLNQLFLLSMILGLDVGTFKIGASPFRSLAEAMPNAPFIQSNPDFVPTDGKGLNDLLKSPWMIIHPPALFLGFSMMAVPYCFAMAALWKRKYNEWVGAALPWTLGANLSLFTAIFLGGYWAYVTLSFGGYWAWDPVENASFIPWLIGTAGIHTMLIQRKSSTSQKASIILAMLAYVTVVYETFLTRSGVLSDSSVHSFVDLGLYNQLLLFMVVILGVGIGMLIYRYKDLPSQQNESKLLSREFMTFAGAMVLFLIGMVMTLGTSSPIIGRLFVENPTPPEISFYNEWTMPLAILAAILTVLGQYLFWKRHNAESLANELLWPVAGACIATLTTIFIGDVRDLYYMLYLLSAWFALFGNASIMFRLARKQPKLIGGTLSHIGFGIMLLGFLASSAYDGNLLDLSAKQYNEAVRKGKVTDENGSLVTQPVNFLELNLHEPKIVNNKYKVTYKGYTLRNQERPGQQEYKIKFEELNEPGNTDTFFLSPQVYPMGKADTTINWSVDVDVMAGFLSDIYLYVAGSSYVERKNEQYRNREEKQNRNIIQPASQSERLETVQQDSVPTQKITLAKGDSVRMGNYRFTFQKYGQVDQSQLPDSTSIAVRALVDIKYDANQTPYRIKPLFALYSDEGKNWVYSPPARFSKHNIEVQFTRVFPESGKIELTVKGISEKPKEEWILLTAEEKPFVSLVWLGTFVLMAGFSVSILRHWSRERKKSIQIQ